MTGTENSIDIVELTEHLGLPAHDQRAVLSWTGRPVDWVWTIAEADELADIWAADTARIEREAIHTPREVWAI